MRIVRLAEQVSDRLQRKSELPAVSDESEALDVATVVAALIARRARGFWHQPDLLVVADRLHLAPALVCEIANGTPVRHNGLLKL